MNRRILQLAIPNVISNVTIPLLGMTDIAVAGHLQVGEAIGAIAVGVAIFGFIYWNCAFIRMGTSGMTAQAFGRRDLKECVCLLIRALIVALAIAALLLIFQGYAGRFSLSLMQGQPEVMPLAAEYFFVRIWAAPATISLYAIHGWFIGMQNSKTPMVVSILMNVVNAALCLWFVFVLGMGIKGIALATVVAQYAGVALSWLFWHRYYRRFLKYVDWRESFRLRPMLRFFNVNRDIFLRTACNVAVYTFFTSASSGYDGLLLDTNAILIQLFTFFSFMSDGFAYAAEALTGQFIGANNFQALRRCLRSMFGWSLGIALVCMLGYGLFWESILSLFTNSPEIIATAGKYIVWVLLVPLAGFAPFLMDGILIGATRTRVLRDSMALSTLVFFGLYYLLAGRLGNDALWLSFIVFLISRGAFQLLMTDRLKGLIR